MAAKIKLLKVRDLAENGLPALCGWKHGVAAETQVLRPRLARRGIRAIVEVSEKR